MAQYDFHSDFDYDALEIATLENILLNPDSSPDVHAGALSAVTKLDPLERTSLLIQIFRNIVRYPNRYNLEVILSAVDALATDPDVYATTAMIEALPPIVESYLSKDPVEAKFREYFYQALLTRQRDEDLEVWAEMLPGLGPKTLIAAVIDPQAGALEALEPLTLMGRLPEPQRTKSLVSCLIGLISTRGAKAKIDEVNQMLNQSADAGELNEGIKVMEQHWEKFRKAGRDQQVELFEAALKRFDKRPRSASERLMGKRPWAG